MYLEILRTNPTSTQDKVVAAFDDVIRFVFHLETQTLTIEVENVGTYNIKLQNTEFFIKLV